MRTKLLILACLIVAWPAHAEELSVQRLTWAGVKIVRGNTTVLIDAVGTDLWSGAAPEGFYPVTVDTPRTYALLTHTHNDHFDPETLKRVLGERGYVICHESIAAYVASRGLRVIPAQSHVPVGRGGFLFTAVPAVDGFGDHQVSWIVTAEEGRYLHAGDTLWHGSWDMIGRQYGPFDAAFLPINGARVVGDPPTETPAVMTPLQALDAALLLRAKRLVPIHFGFNDPPNYVEVEKPLEALMGKGIKRGMPVEHLRPGEFLRSVGGDI